MAEEQRRFSSSARIAMIAAILLVVALLTGAGALVVSGTRGQDTPAGVRYLDPPQDLQNFSLTGVEGQVVRLSDFRGSPALLFFGYTHCPDVCPATLAEFREIKRELGANGGRVTFMFVSVDGSRDSPEVVEAFVNRFDEGFVGLTGSEEQLRRYASDYSLYFNQADASGSASGYLVDHTSSSYLIGPDGRLNAVYPFDTSIITIVQDLERLLVQ